MFFIDLRCSLHFISLLRHPNISGSTIPLPVPAIRNQRHIRLPDKLGRYFAPSIFEEEDLIPNFPNNADGQRNSPCLHTRHLPVNLCRNSRSWDHQIHQTGQRAADILRGLAFWLSMVTTYCTETQLPLNLRMSFPQALQFPSLSPGLKL